jgi:hypothetical protein
MMRHFVGTIGTIYSCIVLCANVPAQAQVAGSIQVYADVAKQSCNVMDTVEASIVTLYVFHSGASDVSSVQFKLEPAAGANMTWLSEVSPYATSGNSQSGIGVFYGGCTSSPTLILTVTYFSQGLSSTCSRYDVVGSPMAIVGASPGLLAVDCSSGEMVLGSDELTVNPNAGCFCDMPTAVAELPSAASVRLGYNYPNPFNPQTTISFTLTDDQFASLDVLDVSGRIVRRLLAGQMSSGEHRATWNGKDQVGNSAASGIYFFRLRAGESTLTRKAILLK